MKKTDELLKIAAKSNITVLLHGESGVGKEVAAHALHENSNRNSGPFIALNCGAIAKNLMESTLEGATKGAFTGASTAQTGVVRAANGGTLFLDEIGEMPYECQSKLLRILQEHAVLPLGTTQPIHVDFRLICATNRDLKADVHNGRFREDLFFRLNAFPIRIPPLRERNNFEEIVQDVWKDVLNATTSEFATCPKLSENDIVQLQMYKWPGNIRQLKNVLQRYALLYNHHINLDEILADEREYNEVREFIPKPNWEDIGEALHKCQGNKMQAAKSLGISRGRLYYQIKKALTAKDLNYSNL